MRKLLALAAVAGLSISMIGCGEAPAPVVTPPAVKTPAPAPAGAPAGETPAAPAGETPAAPAGETPAAPPAGDAPKP